MLDQFNDHKRERFKVVAGIGETIDDFHVDVQDGKLPECEQQGRRIEVISKLEQKGLE